ncbi:MAG: hypothetical protein DMF57_15045 [Acidobacteria bacterium]|nr:MAG: hypothetical protein DMF57_15045 [Acidobacteriota bacterium]
MATAILYFIVAWAMTRLTRVGGMARIALILLPLCFTGRALLTGRIYAPIDLPFGGEPLHSAAASYGVGPGHNGVLSDIYSQNIPWKYAVRQAYAHGEWPLWNPHILCGDILAAAAQPTPYEPFFLSSLLLAMPNSLTYLATITFFLAGLLMFIFLRDLECSEPAALVGAAAWMFSAFFAFWLEWQVATATLWFPLMLTGVRRIIRGGSMTTLTVAFVMILLNGHPETALHATALAFLWAAAELWSVRGRGLVRSAILGVAAGILALLLTAMFILPVMEAIPQTMEHFTRSHHFAFQKKSIPLPNALEHLRFQFLPFRYGDPSVTWPKEPPDGFPDNAYCGSVVLPVALLGLLCSRRRQKWIALSFVIIGLLIGSSFPPFADLLGHLPLFRIALNTRMIFAASFGFAVLTALGVDVLLQERRAATLAVLTVTTFALLLLFCVAQWDAMREWGLPDAFVRGRTIALRLPLVILALATTSRRAAVISAAILLLLLAQRTYEASDFYPTFPSRIFYPRIALLDRLPQTSEPYRIVGQGLMFYPNMSTMYGLEDVRGYQAMNLAPLRQTQDLWSVPQLIWFNRVDDLTRPFLSMMNVRYAFARTEAPIPEGWKRIARDNGNQLLENTRALPRAFIPRRVRVNASWMLLGPELKAESDFGERAWITIEGEPSHEASNGFGLVRIEKLGTRRYVLHASMQSGAWVVITEPAWKGWRATIDGKSKRIHRANHAFLAIFIPQGEHEARLEYWPQSFVVGRRITSATALLLAAGWMWRRAARRGKARQLPAAR